MIKSRVVAALFVLAAVLSTTATAATPPTISGTPPSWVYVGSAYSFRPAVTDPDSTSLRFTIANKPAWASFNTSSGQLSGTPTTVGWWTDIRIAVSDGVSTRALSSFSIRASSRDNTAPVISGSPASVAVIGATYAFQPKASDVDGDPLRFSVANKPAWATFNSASGSLSGTPTAANVGAYSNITISVTDGSKKVSLAPFSITVSSSANRAPTISGTPPAAVTAGQAYMFKPAAADADKNTLGFSIANKPVWATFSSVTGQLSGTPTSTHVGSYANVLISVSDGKANAALAPFTINVAAAANKVPTISGAPQSSVNAGSAYAFRPTAADADGDTLTFSITNRPAWASFNAATGQLSGTPTSASAGTYSNIVIKVSDGKASVALAAFAIAVVDEQIGAASLSWEPPTTNTDGSALTNLAGYRIVYGASPTQLTQTIQVASAGMSSYVIENLAPGTYYFALRAYTTKGVESADSNVVAKVVR
jgi:putative Ig domain-containing protein